MVDRRGEVSANGVDKCQRGRQSLEDRMIRAPVTYAEWELISQDIEALQGLFIRRRQRFFDDFGGPGVLDNFGGRQYCQLRTGGGGSCNGDDIWLHLRGVRDDWKLVNNTLSMQANLSKGKPIQAGDNNRMKVQIKMNGS